MDYTRQNRDAKVSSTFVLVVEDDPAIRIVFEHMITSLGCVVHSVASGSAALEELRRQSFNIIVLDSHLQDMHGSLIARAVRENPELAGTRIIAACSDDSSVNRRLMMDAGADVFTVKPVLPDEIVSLIGLMLNWHA